MIELKNICFKRDNKKILDNINLVLEDNEFYVITGPNGSGKSTLAKMIMGIIKPDSGTIVYNGKDITNESITNRSKLGIAFAFQQPVTFKGITVYDLLKFSTNKDLARFDACKILSKVGLCAKEYIDREVNNSLSGGELKRIEIATILARNAKLYVFDEPEAGIDLWSFNKLNELFLSLHEEKDKTTLIISHQERILALADKIILIENGQIKDVSKNDGNNNFIQRGFCCLNAGGNNE